MSAYDDMCVLASTNLVTQVCSTNISTSTHKNKTSLWRFLDCARLCLLVLLVASPVSSVPVRSRRPSSPNAYSYSSSSSNGNSRLPLAEIPQQEISQPQQSEERSSFRALRLGSEHQELSPDLSNIKSATSSSRSTTSSSSSSSRHHLRSNSRSSRSIRMEDQGDNVVRNRREAHWSQPCTNLMHDTTNTQQSLSEYILRAVATAYSYMDSFRDTYAMTTLSRTWEAAMENYVKDHNVDFLKEITIPQTLDFDVQLQDAYEMMQRLAVGIEQVTLDQALYRGTFLEKFRQIENNIVTILCQLHYAMVHQKLSPSVVVTKDIMGERYRDLDGESARKMRDTIIVREYNHALIHLRDVFNKLKNSP